MKVKLQPPDDKKKAKLAGKYFTGKTTIIDGAGTYGSWGEEDLVMLVVPRQVGKELIPIPRSITTKYLYQVSLAACI